MSKCKIHEGSLDFNNKDLKGYIYQWSYTTDVPIKTDIVWRYSEGI